ncbi:hypothetical protein RvY_17100 [Ramazzottius varieornatus]|uniref:Uncharacterized protein n=1 Tax=Ramazzottius varieornatus TaxID=947166 RepID=A0A1D1W0Y5_RAMVA|nr:hypothetical protein RvY_17100 [Ramazzottius varieornatus]
MSPMDPTKETLWKPFYLYNGVIIEEEIPTPKARQAIHHYYMKSQSEGRIRKSRFWCLIKRHRLTHCL